jgi:RND family efflux transporter MFP subunit
VSSAVSALTTAKNAYDAALSGAQSASNTANSGTQNDIAAAQASLKTALGSLNAAKAALEKTIIRSPITGTIVSLPITRGDYVPSFAQVAVVSNPGALYVELQVTQDEARTLAVGNAATINGTQSGVITFVAPALDPTTGKIQVKVGLTGAAGSLTAGQAVALSLSRSVNATTQKTLKQVTIPIVAAKILPTGPVVFTVSGSSTLMAQPVVLGAILGDQVVVTSNLSLDLPIVADARGLSAGQTVMVDMASTTLH